jgi:hypothetical protein
MQHVIEQHDQGELATDFQLTKDVMTANKKVNALNQQYAQHAQINNIIRNVGTRFRK